MCIRDRLVVNSSQGGGSKDTWVLAGRHSLVPHDHEEREVIWVGTTRAEQGQAQSTRTGDTATEEGR